MNFTENLVLKEHYTFLVADLGGQVEGGERGLYDHDTKFLSRYSWSWASRGQHLMALAVATPRPDTLFAHHALIEGPAQVLAVRRTARIAAGGLRDEVEVSNTSLAPVDLVLSLELEPAFSDVFETRGWARRERRFADPEVAGGAVTFRYVAEDGLAQGVTARLGGEPASFERTAGGARAAWSLTLAPGEARLVTVELTVDNPVVAGDAPRPSAYERGAMSYEEWRRSFDGLWSRPLASGGHRRSLERAVDDLRALLLFTEEGPVAAAGIPWFVAAFGRDSLITGHLLLPYRPDVAAGTLRHLARWQARTCDYHRAAQPGKIMHELRFGELTRLGITPHAPYYGSIDATPLFLMLLGAYVDATGDAAILAELRGAWEAALAWTVDHGDLDGDGFLEFDPEGGGAGHLSVQSWKDSQDSMSHAGGELARGALAVSEVQGYAYAAYVNAARWYRDLGDEARAGEWEGRATALKAAFDRAFWLEGKRTYAMALDGDKRPLEVLSSDAGQLLWCGIVPEERAPELVRTLFSPACWSGWGLRTLGAGEARYNPVSYHNGSVWPHDTALFAAGLVRYGFLAEAAMVRDALLDLTLEQGDLRLPELVAGYARDERPPVPYPVACRPQAWDAAALLYLASLDI